MATPTTMAMTSAIPVTALSLFVLRLQAEFFLSSFQSKGADRKLKVEMQKLEHKTKEELVR